MPFPNTVNQNWTAGFAGTWASENPHRLAVPGPNGFRAGTGGLGVARFAWVQSDGATLLNTAASGAPLGIVLRDQSGLTTAYLQESTMTLPQGFMAGVAQGGDVFATSSTAATLGQAVFASLGDGTISTAAPGSTVEGAVQTGWVVSQGNAAGAPIIITAAV